jgi:dolichol-phosphate mannosyltransferase
MNVSVIIPVYNEERYIRHIIEAVNSIKIDKEIIIIDDGSTDKSLKIVKEINFNNLVLLSNDKNMGKGFSIRKALKYVKNEIIIIQDADLEYDPNDYYKLLEPFKNKNISVVYGSRFLGIKRIIYSKGINYNFRALINLILTKIFNFLNDQKITDAHTCYKVFRKELLKDLNLKEKGFSFCPEFSTKISVLGHKIHEVPISYNPRSKKEGKKIAFSDGFQAIRTLLQYRFFD